MKFLSMKDWTKSDWGKQAITGILGGGALTMAYKDDIVLDVIGGVVSLAGVYCLFKWFQLRFK